MAKTLAQLQAQMAELQQQADAIIAKEKAGVVTNIMAAIADYGLTREDLFGTGRAKRSVVKKQSGRSTGTAKPKGRIKFKDGNGNTWSGVGKRPNWFKAALAAGQSPDELLA